MADIINPSLQPKPGFGPWSDGVPFVTQCSVPGNSLKGESNTFTYQFNATKYHMNAPPGTYWYHSHVGAQRTNGLEGALIIKDKKPLRQYSRVIDKPGKQTIVLQEWYKSPTCQVPVSILVNGKSRIPKQTFYCDDEETRKYLQGHGAKFPKMNSEPLVRTSYEIFRVSNKKNKKNKGNIYRFRILGLIGQNFPIRFSIDNHTFSAIASDSLYISPVNSLTNLWLAAGERYDILLKTKKNVANFPEAFKMRFLGFGDITDSSTALCSIAWLKYPGQKIDDSYITPHDCRDFDLVTPSKYPPAQRTLNPPGISYEDWTRRLQFPDWKNNNAIGSIYPLDMRSLSLEDTSNVHSKQFIKFNPSNTFNNIRTTFPRIPYLLQSKGRVQKFLLSKLVD